MRTHSGEKTFGCTLCDKRFLLNKALYKHIREKHPKFFPEFKKMNDLPLNMRRAREKMKKDGELYGSNAFHVNDFSEATEIKDDDLDVKPDINNINLDVGNSSDIKPDVKSLLVSDGYQNNSDMIDVKHRISKRTKSDQLPDTVHNEILVANVKIEKMDYDDS